MLYYLILRYIIRMHAKNIILRVLIKLHAQLFKLRKTIRIRIIFYLFLLFVLRSSVARPSMRASYRSSRYFDSRNLSNGRERAYLQHETEPNRKDNMFSLTAYD